MVLNNNKSIICLIRRDTLKNFQDNNPVLHSKELVVAYDEENMCNKYYIGDGINPFNYLWPIDLNTVSHFNVYTDNGERVLTIVTDYKCCEKIMQLNEERKETKNSNE